MSAAFQRKIKLLFFAPKLLLVNIPFLVRFGTLKITRFRVLLLTIVLFSATWFLVRIDLAQSTPITQEPISLIIPPQLNSKSSATRQHLLTKLELEQTLRHYRELLLKQPTHRDLLLNVGLIEKYLGNEDLWQQNLSQASNLDPNHNLFLLN